MISKNRKIISIILFALVIIVSGCTTQSQYIRKCPSDCSTKFGEGYGVYGNGSLLVKYELYNVKLTDISTQNSVLWKLQLNNSDVEELHIYVINTQLKLLDGIARDTRLDCNNNLMTSEFPPLIHTYISPNSQVEGWRTCNNYDMNIYNASKGRYELVFSIEKTHMAYNGELTFDTNLSEFPK